MGSGTSRSSLTREECKQRVPEGKWDEYWDDFYFADGKSVSSEIAERVWCKAERWAAHVASAQAAAEPKNGGTMESVPESPREGVRDSDEGGEAAAARERSLVARARWKRSIAHAGWAASLHAKARRRAKERAALDANATEALDERWAVIESDFERVVPQKDGRYAPEEGNLEDIKEVISRAVPIANQYYEGAWAKCQEKGDVDAFLALSAALAADFRPQSRRSVPCLRIRPSMRSSSWQADTAVCCSSRSPSCGPQAVNIHVGRANLRTGSSKRQKMTTAMNWRASSMSSGPQVFLTTDDLSEALVLRGTCAAIAS